jgi:hypothetical protein
MYTQSGDTEVNLQKQKGYEQQGSNPEIADLLISSVMLFCDCHVFTHNISSCKELRT